MMKWKARTETTNIGILELGDMTFNEDYLEVSIDICDMSDNLKAEIDRAVEIEKVKYTKEHEAWNAENDCNFPTVWSNKPVIMQFTYLRVVLETGKPVEYNICFGFVDADNDMMEAWGGSITVDLSEYANELKKAIVKALVDKFF